MFLKFASPEGKPIYSHTSLLDEEKQLHVRKIYDGEVWYKRGFTFGAFYLMMEAVNRVSFLKSKSLLYRTALVLVPAIAARSLASRYYWGVLDKNSEIMKVCENAFVYNDILGVPELDKMFFFLDDDLGYQPSLLHHGM